MRIVKLSELSEKERTHVLEQQEIRKKKRKEQHESELQRVNQLLKQTQSEQKNTITTTISKDNNTKQNNTLLDNVQNFASGTGKVVDNLWQSLKNGVMSYQQTVGRAANNTQAEHADLINNMHKKVLEGRLKDNPEEAEQINEIINNSLISGDKIREESKEYYNKIQNQKNKNIQKIQENTDSIQNPIGKYLAGEIAPGIGQMLPGMVGGPIGTTYFIGSATGNYYDDAMQRGMSEDQATKYSGIMGTIEGTLEALGANLSTKVGKQLLNKNIKGALIDYGLDIGENFLEESIVEPISEAVAGITGGQDKANWNNIGQRMWESGVAGAVTSIITGGTSGMIGGLGSKVSQQNKYKDHSTSQRLNKDNIKYDISHIDKNDLPVANNRETIYNYIESESDTNGYNSNEQRRIENIYKQKDEGKQREIGNTINRGTINSIMEGENQNDAKVFYEKYEQEARINQITNITSQQQQVKQFAKNKYGKNLIYYDDSNTQFSGGLSKTDNNSVFFGKNAVNDFGETFLLGHEIGEDMLKYHKDKVGETFETLKEKIQNDDNFADIFLEYIFDMDENLKDIYIEHPEAVAKELICDTLGFMQNNNELENNLPHKDISNVWINKLNPNLLIEMKSILKDYHDKIYTSTNEVDNVTIENNTINLQQNGIYNQNNINNQQLVQVQQKNAQNGISEQTNNNYMSEEFKKGLEQFKSGKYTKHDNIVLLNETPQWLYNKGYEYEQPIVINMDKLSTIMKEPKGRFNGKNQHGITMDLIEQLPEAISNPLNVIKNPKFNNRYVVVTSLTDQYGDIVLVPIEMNDKGYVSGIETNVNRASSMYGKEYYDLPKNDAIDSYMERNKDNIVYDIDTYKKNSNTTNDGLQSPLTSSITTSNTSIPPTSKIVNSTTNNYSMQKSENNSNSFSLTNDTKISDDDIAEKDMLVQQRPTIESEVGNTEKTTLEESVEKNIVAKILKKAPENVKEKDRKWAIFKANILDKGIVFEELSLKTNNRDLQGKWDYTLSSTSRGQNAIGKARYEFDAKTKTQKQICKSLEDIRQEVGDKVHEFNEYMYHQLNIDRMTLEERFGGDTGTNYEKKYVIKNKPVFGHEVTAKISQQYIQELEQKYPEFKQWAKDVYDYNNANKKELIKNGVISQKLADKLEEMYPHYVPIKRINNSNTTAVLDDANKTGVNSTLLKAKGGNQDILPLFETMADRTLQTYVSSARNNFGVELMNTLNNYKETQEMDLDTVLEEIGDADANAQLLQNGNNPTFTVYDNGKKVTFEITKDMYDALKPTNDILKGLWIGGIPNKVSNFRRGVLTEYNPLFMITNAIKDIQEVPINSQHAIKTYMKFPEAYTQIVQKGYWYEEYVQNGGKENSYFKDGKFENSIDLPIGKKIITFPLKAISGINNVIEMAPRLAEYIASREAGRSIETSMLDAARVTTNFKAGGDVIKALNRNGFTFLNASVQGAMQQVRNIKEANAKGLKGWTVLACKYAIAGLPAVLLNNLLWNDDEDYEELQDYVKDNYYCIAKYDDGKFIRIPKGRTTATIQKIVNNATEYITEDKKINIDNLAKDFWEDITFAIDNLAPNNPLDNNVISPIIQAITNTSWYGEDIVPSRLQNKPKAEQYDETTDKFSIWLGEKLNISPYKINYVLDQYLGGIGDVLLPFGTPQAENNPIEDKFTTDSVMKSKYPGEFFAKVDELEVNKNSSKATDEDILKYKYISSISSNISELYTKKRKIQNSSATDKEKKEQLKEVQKQINELAKNGLEKVDTITNTDTTATINGINYYKYKGEWKEVSEEEQEKIGNISLKTYADYQNKVYNKTQTQRATGILEDGEYIKNKDKIEILLDSNYSNKEIADIYDNCIKSEKDTEYDIMKSAGIDIKEYLKYKQQDFESDYYDDGTLTGKTVSKSKQKKIVQYLNSMKINSNQRLLLYAMQGYSTTSSQKTQLENYVNSLKISSDTKLKIFDKFSGFKVYKNGQISW